MVPQQYQLPLYKIGFASVGDTYKLRNGKAGMGIDRSWDKWLGHCSRLRPSVMRFLWTHYE
eukprot:2638070-Rhodomonas_salina.2